MALILFDLILSRFSLFTELNFFSQGPVENIHPAILMSENIDLYNIIMLRSIDVITSFVCIVNIDVIVNIR